MKSYTDDGLFCNNDVFLHSARLKSPEELALNGYGLFLMFPMAGGGEWWDGTRSQGLAPGDVLVVNVETEGRLRAVNGGSLVFSCFSLGVEQLWAICATPELCLLQSVMERLRTPRRHLSMSIIAQRCANLLSEVPSQQNVEHRSQLLRAAAAVLRAEFQEVLPPRNGYVRSEEHVLQALEKLQASDIMSLSIEELAAKFNCSRRQLDRWFQRYLGRSPRGLKMELRLLRAASLLRDPVAKVINVADECGFHHLGLFNTCFRRRFEVSPSQWRARVRESDSQLVNLLEGHPECGLRAQGLCAWEGKKKPALAIPARGEKALSRSQARLPLAKGHQASSWSFERSNKDSTAATKKSQASVMPSGIAFRVRF
jgi:AraC-like DNA-binding protein